MLLVFLLLLGAALGWTWLGTELQRQDKWIRSPLLAFAAGAGLLGWVLLGSGWPRRAR